MTASERLISLSALYVLNKALESGCNSSKKYAQGKERGLRASKRRTPMQGGFHPLGGTIFRSPDVFLTGRLEISQL